MRIHLLRHSSLDDMVEIDKDEYLRREKSYREKLKKRGKK